jgi:pilus assembly protein Flp/PilA
MRDFLMKLYVKAQLFREDNGQDLIEYALVAALIALGAIVGMGQVATAINVAFTTISGHLGTNAT